MSVHPSLRGNTGDNQERTVLSRLEKLKKLKEEGVGVEVLVAGAEVEDILPGFFYEGRVKDPEIDGERFRGEYDVYSGDHAERRAKGRIYVRV